MQFIANGWKAFWAGIAAAIIVVLSWFNISAPGWLADYTTTKPTTTIAVVTTKAPQPFTVDLAKIKALGLPNVTKTITTKNDYGTVKSYDVVGPTLKSVLAALGADMPAINSKSILFVECNDPTDPAEANYNYFLINSGDSIMALTINGSEDDAPRLFPAVESGQQYAFSGKAVKCVDAMILNYN